MKQKTHSGAKKRFQINKKGRAQMQKAAKRHLLVNKSKGQKRLGKKKLTLSASNVKKIKKLLNK